MNNKLMTFQYVIYVKLDSTSNKYLLIHGYTGAIDLVSDKIVSCLKDNAVDLIPKNIITKLVERGYLTNKCFSEEQEYVIRMANILHRKMNLISTNFTFIVSYDCNFRCPYCYENSISNAGESWTRKTFTPELVDKAYEAMIQIQSNRDLHIKQIDLYGGEPLLAYNRNIVEYIIKKGLPYNYTFRAITNGYDLDQYEDLLSPSMIGHLQITIDGIKERYVKEESIILRENLSIKLSKISV